MVFRYNEVRNFNIYTNQIMNMSLLVGEIWSAGDSEGVLNIQRTIINRLERVNEIRDTIPILQACEDISEPLTISLTCVDCVAALFRIYCFLVDMSKKNSRRMPDPINEEYFEGVVFFAHDFVGKVLNQNVTKENGSPTKQKSKKETLSGFDAACKRRFTTMVSIFDKFILFITLFCGFQRLGQ
jgi:hypothetical protein